MVSHTRWLISVACARCFLLGLYCAAIDFAISDHDASGVSRIEGQVHNVLKTFSKWDSAHYVRISLHGYVDEQDFAFYPLYPWCMRVLAIPFRFLGLENAIIAGGLLCSMIAFVIAGLVLERLLRRVGMADEKSIRLALLCYVFNPASIFFNTVYTESLYAVLSWGAMLVMIDSPFSVTCRVASMVLLCLASSTRSNSSLLLISVCVQLLCRSHVAIVKRNVEAIFIHVSNFGGQLVALAAPHVFFSYYTHHKLCVEPDQSTWFAVENQTMCRSDTGLACTRQGVSDMCPGDHMDIFAVLSMYTRVQQKHWGVGAFRYYQLMQVPNFLLATPVICISVWTLRYQWPCIQAWIESMVPVGKPNNHLFRPLSETDTTRVCMSLHLMGSLAVVLIFAHVQVATRVLFSACPILYAGCAALHQHDSRIVQRAMLSYFAMYVCVGAALHVNFFPWT